MEECIKSSPRVYKWVDRTILTTELTTNEDAGELDYAHKVLEEATSLQVVVEKSSALQLSDERDACQSARLKVVLLHILLACSFPRSGLRRLTCI